MVVGLVFWALSLEAAKWLELNICGWSILVEQAPRHSGGVGTPAEAGGYQEAVAEEFGGGRYPKWNVVVGLVFWALSLEAAQWLKLHMWLEPSAGAAPPAFWGGRYPC